jgi:hypothetical protein
MTFGAIADGISIRLGFVRRVESGVAEEGGWRIVSLSNGATGALGMAVRVSLCLSGGVVIPAAESGVAGGDYGLGPLG